MMEVEPTVEEAPHSENTAETNDENADPIVNLDDSSKPSVTNVYNKAAGDADVDSGFTQDMGEDNEEATKSSSSGNSAVVFSPELLKMYYSRLFPYELLHSWLSYDPCHKHPTLFSRREFSMTIEPSAGEEIYIRYQSFHNQDEMTQAILKRRPTKIDLGAIFTHPPKDHKTIQKGKFLPVQRELVFDIDLTDYDDIRHCGCTGANICPTCWVFMTMAVQVMDKGLRQDFGFQHVAWFYSGRRGVHAWVCDESARTLTNEARNAVASYFEVSLGSEKNKEFDLPSPLHPSLKRAYDILEPWFVDNVIPASGHGLMASEERWTGLLHSLPDAGQHVAALLAKKWSDPKLKSSPEEKWKQLTKTLNVACGKSEDAKAAKAAKILTTKQREKLELWPFEVVFRHTYPRLDINVSKTMNHLLKSPFCVHPKTGRVCVPIDPNDVAGFDPFVVPNLSQLMAELDDYEKTRRSSSMEEDDTDKTNDQKERTRAPRFDWQKTSLKKYFEPFQRKFLEPMLKELRKKEKMAVEQEAAVAGDF